MVQQVILERDAELAALAAAVAAAEAGHGCLVLVEGPAGIGKTTLLRAACRGPGARVLTARGLALEQGFGYGIVRQLLDPVRGEDGLMDGAAALAARVFDWAEAGPVEDDVRYAAMHGLYWLVANLAARQPLVLAVDDAHWADAPSLRWLAHLAARVEHLPVALLLAVRDGPDEPELIGELRAAGTRIRLEPLGPDATAALVRRRLGALPGALPGAVVGALVGDGAEQLGRDWHASTGGNPFLLEALAAALRDGDQKAEPIAQAVLRRIGPEGPEGKRLARALAVLGGPAPLRQAAALAGLDLPAAARLADRLRAADVLAPGSVLEFAHPIVRTAVYESIPPGERALAHAEAARLLERDGADAERLALHLLRSEPGSDPRVAALLRAAATAATGRGAPGAAAACLRRALDEPPPAADRPGLLLELGIALARERSPAAVPALREAVELTGPDAALLAARVLGIWAYHAEAAAICRAALAAPFPDRLPDDMPDELADSLQAELFQNALISAETVGEAVTLARRTGRSPAWGVNDALLAATSADGDVTRPALDGISSDSLSAVYALLVLIWTDELEQAGRICDTVLTDARRRGSMSMVAHASCLHSMIMQRLGRLEEAADAARLALDFKLATSPPLAVAWAAALGVDALTRLGRLAEAEAMAASAGQPPEGWIHTLTFRQVRGALRVAQHRPAEALDDLYPAGAGWQALGVTNPAVAAWRTAAAAAHRALGQDDAADALAAEQLALARKAGSEVTLGIALRAHGDLAEAVSALEATPARYELALALADHGASLRCRGQRTRAREPLLRALDLAERTGAAGLAAEVKRELLAAGARPRRSALTGPDALTAGERRVAALAAEGASNRQIAEHLFITQATVETHLRHAFRKLGITSRADLPASLDT
jgi:DNA-binding NarL/FixJ family response regulator